MSARNKKRQPLSGMIASAVEFPIEGIENIPVIELKGRSEAYVTGCRSIIEYESCVIVFDAGKYRICIRGEDLLLSDFLSGSVCISGCITDISIN